MGKLLTMLLAAAMLPGLKSQPVVVMTYNLRYDNPGDGVNQWSNRADAVGKLIAKYDPGVLGVQEALHHQIIDIIRRLPSYGYVGVGRDDGKNAGEFSAILFKKDRFNVEDSGTFWLSETPDVPGSKDWDAAITRIATWAKLKDIQTGKRFLMMNTHFDHIGVVAREKSAELLKRKALILAGDIQVILSGDFNSEPTTDAYHTLVHGEGQPLSDTRPPGETTGTYCGFEVGAMDCRTIDYIFVSPKWQVKRFEVIRDRNGKYYPSDHFPVLAAVE